MLFVILLLPLLLGIGCFFMKNAFSKAHTALLLTVQSAVVALLGYAAFGRGTWETAAIHLTDSLTFALQLDGLGALFCLLASVCWLLTIPYCTVYLHHEEHVPRFYGFYFLTETMVLGTALAADLVTHAALCPSCAAQPEQKGAVGRVQVSLLLRWRRLSGAVRYGSAAA